MAVALRPAEFDFGAEAPDGSAWELFGETYDTNPRLQLTEAETDMVRLWRLYRGGLGGPGPLPDPGGTMDQPVIMLEAFDVMSSAARAFEDQGDRR